MQSNVKGGKEVEAPDMSLSIDAMVDLSSELL